MILIATIILSLPILSKASPTNARRAVVPSCAVNCLDKITKPKGCPINDTKCICDISFGTESTLQSTAAQCLLSSCAFEERESFFDYLYSTCYGADVGSNKVTGSPLVNMPFTVTLTGDGQVVTNVPAGVTPVYVYSSPGMTVAEPTAATPASTVAADLSALLPSGWKATTTDAAQKTPTPPTPLRTSNQGDGLSLGGKIAIGIIVPIASLGFIFGLLRYLKARKRDQHNFRAPPLTDNDIEHSGPGLPAREGVKAELPSDDVEHTPHTSTAAAYNKPELAGTHFDGAVVPVSARESESEDDRNKPIKPPRYNASEVYGSGAQSPGSHIELDGHSPYDSRVELDGQPSHHIPELSPSGVSPMTARSHLSPQSAVEAPSSPQHNTAHVMGGKSPRDENINRAVPSEAEHQRPLLAGPIPSATDLYPPTRDSDRVDVEEQEKRLEAKRAKVTEMRNLAEEEALLEREEETLRRRKAAHGGQ